MPDRGPSDREILAFQAAELRMVATLLEGDGRLAEAAIVRENALKVDPPPTSTRH